MNTQKKYVWRWESNNDLEPWKHNPTTIAALKRFCQFYNLTLVKRLYATQHHPWNPRSKTDSHSNCIAEGRPTSLHSPHSAPSTVSSVLRRIHPCTSRRCSLDHFSSTAGKYLHSLSQIRALALPGHHDGVFDGWLDPWQFQRCPWPWRWRSMSGALQQWGRSTGGRYTPGTK